MRLPILLLLTVIAIGIAVDWRIYAIFHSRLKSKVLTRVHLASGTLMWILLIVAICLPRRDGSDATLLAVMWMLFTFLSVYLSKIIYVVFDALSCIPRLWKGKRWHALGMAGGILSLVVLIAFWWGALVNRFAIDVVEVDVEVAGLPASLDGMTIAQFSDLHTGTFGSDTAFVCRVVDKINALNPDLIVFTGDIVNRKTEELFPHMKPLSRLHAPLGVYSILGNHDYGDYSEWPTQEAKQENLNQLVEAQQKMGWHLLLDSHVYLHSGSDSIALVGVENIGDPPFPSYGSLKRARPADTSVPWILLSHNPAHWDMEILKSDAKSLPVELTLSGHTHAMQIRAFGLSPAGFRYPRWGGMYSNPSDSRKLYVNIGAGTVGMPARIGATPEITLFTLHTAKK